MNLAIRGIEADLVDCMVALPGQLFYSTQIPVCRQFAESTKPTADTPRLSRGRTRDDAIFPIAPPAASMPESYAATLQEIKTHLRSARIRAVLAANPIVIEAYWHTGKIILARQQEAAWGTKVIDRLAQNQLHLRTGKAQNNFALTMPEAESDMAAQLFKDPYLFDFLGTADPRRCRVANAVNRIPAQRTARQSAQHRGDRGRANAGFSPCKAPQKKQGMSSSEKKMPRLIKELHAQIAPPLSLKQAIKANLRGLGIFLDIEPKALPWAIAVRPAGAFINRKEMTP